MMVSGTIPSATLQQEIDAVRQLQQLLEQEQSHLLKADIAGLEALLKQKAVVVDRMAQLADARYNALAAAGLPAEEAGMQAWIERDASQETAAQSWRELLELTATTKELNRINGMLIGGHMARNQGALQILQNSAPGEGTYGADGRHNIRTSGRNFVVG